MSENEECKDEGKLVAILDGFGKAAEFGLYREFKNGDVEDIPWPEDWPDLVTIDFVKAAGYDVIRA